MVKPTLSHARAPAKSPALARASLRPPTLARFARVFSLVLLPPSFFFPSSHLPPLLPLSHFPCRLRHCYHQQGLVRHAWHVRALAVVQAGDGGRSRRESCGAPARQASEAALVSGWWRAASSSDACLAHFASIPTVQSGGVGVVERTNRRGSRRVQWLARASFAPGVARKTSPIAGSQFMKIVGESVGATVTSWPREHLRQIAQPRSWRGSLLGVLPGRGERAAARLCNRSQILTQPCI